jgi:hypothetical protein
MKPVKTVTCNANFTADGCDDLPVAVGKTFLASYWRPSLKEWLAILFGTPIRLVINGHEQPQVMMDTEL